MILVGAQRQGAALGSLLVIGEFGLGSRGNMSFASRSPQRARLCGAGLRLAAFVACALLSGCSASQLEDHLPAAVGGLPDDAPARPATQAAYPAVHAMPPSRTATPLTDDQQKQLADELVAARNRYGVNPDGTATTGSTSSSGNSKAAASAPNQ